MNKSGAHARVGVIVAALIAVRIFYTIAVADAAPDMRTDQLMWACEDLDPDTSDKLVKLLRCLGYLDGVVDFQAVVR